MMWQGLRCSNCQSTVHDKCIEKAISRTCSTHLIYHPLNVQGKPPVTPPQHPEDTLPPPTPIQQPQPQRLSQTSLIAPAQSTSSSRSLSSSNSLSNATISKDVTTVLPHEFAVATFYNFTFCSVCK